MKRINLGDGPTMGEYQDPDTVRTVTIPFNQEEPVTIEHAGIVTQEPQYIFHSADLRQAFDHYSSSILDMRARANAVSEDIKTLQRFLRDANCPPALVLELDMKWDGRHIIVSSDNPETKGGERPLIECKLRTRVTYAPKLPEFLRHLCGKAVDGVIDPDNPEPAPDLSDVPF